jgi:hypothetical protein
MKEELCAKEADCARDQIIRGGNFRMNRWLVWSLLFFALGLAAPAQDLPGPQDQKPAPPPVPESKVPQDAAVITISGLCDTRYLPGTKAPYAQDDSKSDLPSVPTDATLASVIAADASCKTAITRAQFEILISGLAPNMPPDARRRVAERYPDMLFQAQLLHQLGIDKDPAYVERLKFNYMEMLGRTLVQYLQKKSGDLTDAEIETYYKEHPDNFRRVNMLRLYILNHRVYSDVGLPAGKRNPHPTPAEAVVDADAMKAEAERLHKEAVAGVSFERLEAAAYKAAHDTDDTPDVKLENLTVDRVPAQYESAVFDLPVGKVSDLVADNNGWNVFKVLSKDTVPLSEAKPIIQKLRMREMTAMLKDGVKADLNDDYFTPPTNKEKPGWK